MNTDNEYDNVAPPPKGEPISKSQAKRLRRKLKREWKDLPWWRKVATILTYPFRWIKSAIIFRHSTSQSTEEEAKPEASRTSRIAKFLGAIGASIGVIAALTVTVFVKVPLAILYAILSYTGILSIGSKLWSYSRWGHKTEEVFFSAPNSRAGSPIPHGDE